MTWHAIVIPLYEEGFTYEVLQSPTGAVFQESYHFWCSQVIQEGRNLGLQLTGDNQFFSSKLVV